MEMTTLLFLIPGLITWFLVKYIKVPKKYRSPATFLLACVVFLIIANIPNYAQYAPEIFLSILGAGTINGLNKSVFPTGET